MHKERKDRGAVSVFLTLILVPCLVVSSVFIDVSRVKLGEGLSVSAADMALNSLMTNYDADLSEFYGMMASCQSIEEFYEESAQYYLDALHSQGLDDDEIDSLLALYSSVMGDDTVYDLLEIEVQSSEDSEIIQSVEGAALGESATLVKDQVVEFMKYRAPVEIIKGIVERLKNNNASKELGEADANEDLVKDKREYADAESELLEAAYMTYVCLEKYSDMKISLTEIKKLMSDLTLYRELYREINQKIIINLSNTSGLNVFSRPTYVKDSLKYTKQQVCDAYTSADGGKTYYVETDSMKDVFVELETAIAEFRQARTNLVSAAGSCTDMVIGTEGSDANPVQWWVRVNEAVNTGAGSQVSKVNTSIQKMMKAYEKMKAMNDCEKIVISEDGNVLDPSDSDLQYIENKYNSLESQIIQIQNSYLTYKYGSATSGDSYIKLMYKLETVSADNINNIDYTQLRLSNGKTIGETVKEISTNLNAYRERFEEAIDTLDTLLNGGKINGKKVTKLDKLTKLAATYNQKYKDWKDTAYSTYYDGKLTDMAEADKTAIEDEKSDVSKICEAVTEENVKKLKTRIANVRSRLQEVVDAIDSMKYGNRHITDIGDYGTVYNAVKSKIDKNSIGITNSSLEDYSEQVFSKVFTPYSADREQAVYTVSNLEDSEFNPDIKTTNTPKLYKFLIEKFKNTDADKVEENKQKVEGKKSEAKEAEDDSKDKDRSEDVTGEDIYGNDNYDAGEFPSGLDKEDSFALGSGIISGVTGLVESIVELDFTDIRDSVYSAEYVMDMFSYASYANEGKYNLLCGVDSDGKPLTIDTCDNAYSSVTGSADEKGTWLSEAITDSYNKTLTNKMINSTNNAAFGAEVEYILYGGTNKDNIKAAYADIYTIRYALNTVSGFENFWGEGNDTGKVINSVAKSISVATEGIIPVVFTKCVLILLLTAVETAQDLNRLQRGLPVEIYKTKDDWYFSFDDEGNSEKSNTQDSTINKGIFYSDYLYMFLYLGFEKESTAEEMYLRMADLMQANLRKLNNSSVYSLKKSQVYFKLEAEVRVKPLMLTLPVAASYSNNPKDKTDWCTFKISQIRGYS